MNDHDQYEELAALSAGGFLSENELQELREHARGCLECLESEQAFDELARSGLPLTMSPIREFLDRRQTQSDTCIRERFLKRARHEGIAFSPEVAGLASQRPMRSLILVAATMGVAATFVLVSYGARIYRGVAFEGSTQAQQQIEQLQQQNAALQDTLSRLSQSLTAGRREIQDLRAQLGTATRASENLRHDSEQRTSSQTVQLAGELANRDKQLAEARSEIERINELRSFDEASLVAQQVKIADLSDQLRIAGATLDLERQLTAAGKDIRELLVARQLHVIDVRDTNVNGKPSRAFGRIFVSEGKSLTFYAFDLSQERSVDAKHRFEVWGSQQAKGSPARSLGFFYVDDKTQSRWALRVTDPDLVKEVDSVFVTVEPAGGAPTPSGQTMLYAYLGQPNHP